MQSRLAALLLSKGDFNGALALVNKLLRELALDALINSVRGEQPVAGRRWRVVFLAHARSVTRLGLQLERRLEKVDV